ncbi:uncharacterized protein LOC108810207 isoform X2 [Raphanus sativus]|uniref:Uncharacterized protein LOC108810207 isoform X2 n=1 Tax=Raphanus sativus TaxID=3726 RepID=A0A6J0JQ89_RAPSA|nr:uncharacterized protein LOC108810207 isoform X2 [Raphanus sativus]XP_018439264.1 PREDICTED: NADPH-dependent diflavin oxidoreductase 1-like isoform X2 [Raphanus sativus]
MLLRRETLLMRLSILAAKLNTVVVLPLSSPSMNSTQVAYLMRRLLFLLYPPTTGQRDSLDYFKSFGVFFFKENLGNSWLQRLRFAVFGLGDSGYQKYNWCWLLYARTADTTFPLF